ncbi:pyridoxamine 5'-phosphate oxidase family protein [Glaciecola petra]|uniref:Pyridoxamine 5'-phosphate oxidase family protein n=1 Tax=Glaciecola petra TaxID=3075602 RepID=A0ABU2ZPP1_9ALTE|nr:pyridoxamine 5'-phosphate oxidase family protein [Aestuariibacter sp. P117]MDT0594324.1 pyridoxamine 5'-phosphate oxidase family protein [Aestuariibacter sp. P117]
MSFPPWRQSLARSLHKHRSKPESKYFQVASVDSDGKPRNRTMVHRGFLDGSNSIIAISDTRSAKFNDFANLAEAEICWYFSITREQYRIQSKVVMHRLTKNDGEETLATTSLLQVVWNTLSDAAKSQFYWPSPKSDAIQNQSQNQNEAKKSSIPKEHSSPECYKTLPANFAVLIFSPLEVDYLHLKTQPQTRIIYSVNKPKLDENANCLIDETWCEKSVNP